MRCSWWCAISTALLFFLLAACAAECALALGGMMPTAALAHVPTLKQRKQAQGQQVGPACRGGAREQVAGGSDDNSSNKRNHRQLHCSCCRIRLYICCTISVSVSAGRAMDIAAPD